MPVATLAPPPRPETPARTVGLENLMTLAGISWLGGNKYREESREISRAWTGSLGGPSGGYLLKPEWADVIWDKARERRGPFSRCLFVKTTSKEFYLPSFHETSRADGSRWGGVWGRWRGAAETESLTTNVASQPAMAQIQFNMNRLLVYTAPISLDLVRDSTLLKPMLDLAVYEEFRFQCETAILTGSGAGQPQGVVSAEGCVTVAKDGGQSAGTISSTNLDGMWKALYGPCRRNACWYANDDTMLAIDEVATAFNWPQSVYLPQGAFGNDSPLIKGRPLLPSEALPAIGTPGDIVLCDFSQYLFVYHVMNDADSGIEMAIGMPGDSVESTESDHFLWDQNARAYRWKLRADGRLLFPSTITNKNGFTVGAACVIAQR
jgi:HK97 family phage major capsid protein